MRTVGQLIKELMKFPSDAQCWAYEGEAVGIAIDLGELGHGFVFCSPSDHEEPESEGDEHG